MNLVHVSAVGASAAGSNPSTSRRPYREFFSKADFSCSSICSAVAPSLSKEKEKESEVRS